MPLIRKIAPPLQPQRLMGRIPPPELNAAGMLHDGEHWLHIDHASKRWQIWLAKHDRIHVQIWHGTALHTVTARMKRVKGHPYWYLEKKINGVTYCRYLGKAEVMNWYRISTVAADLIASISHLPGLEDESASLGTSDRCSYPQSEAAELDMELIDFMHAHH